MSRKTRTQTPKTVKAWKDLDILWNRLVPERLGSGCGVLLIGPYLQGEEKALSLANEKSRNVLVVRPEDGRSHSLVNLIKEWLGRKGTLFEKLDSPVLVALELDRLGDRMHGFLKHDMETAHKTWLCIATCEDVRLIPGWCSSMFLPVRGLYRSPNKKKPRIVD